MINISFDINIISIFTVFKTIFDFPVSVCVFSYRLAENWSPETPGETLAGGTGGNRQQARRDGSASGLTGESVRIWSQPHKVPQCLYIVWVLIFSFHKLPVFKDLPNACTRSIIPLFLISLPSSLKCKTDL